MTQYSYDQGMNLANTEEVHLMMGQLWANVYNTGPVLNQHGVLLLLYYVTCWA